MQTVAGPSPGSSATTSNTPAPCLQPARPQQSRPVKNTDYLVLGAGAMGMAFADVLLTETDATLTIVDRRGRPGGHWNDAYPFVRLHQPSRFYGVNSRPLGTGAKDAVGWNRGLYELASGAEVLAYFDAVLHEHFLPSGRVRFLPMTEHLGDGRLRSLVTGEEFRVEAGKTVDATYMNVNVPAMRRPTYEVAEDARVVPPNALFDLKAPADAYVVIGAGKTGMDACLWLLAQGADPEKIRWVMPRDSWMMDRANVQPGAEFFEASLGGMAMELEIVLQSKSLDDLFTTLETRGRLLRLHADVQPTMYRCATVTTAELDQLRRIRHVIRLGRVQRVGGNRIDLDGGSIATTRGTLHIDCTADGLERRPPRAVFDGSRLTLQSVRTCQQVFSAAFIAHVEATGAADPVKNDICRPVPHPDSSMDWLRAALADFRNGQRWQQDEELMAWLAACRLDVTAAFAEGVDPSDVMQVLGRMLPLVPAAIEKLETLIAGAA